MAGVDFRVQMACNIGPIQQGSISDGYIQDQGLITTKGNLTLDGIYAPAKGAEVVLAYARPQYGTLTRFPRRLRVLRSSAYPYDNKTTIEVGDILTLNENRKRTDQYTSSKFPPDWYSVLNMTQKEYLSSVSYAQGILQYCLGKIGLSLASGATALKSAFLDDFDLTSGYVNVMNGLLKSERVFGWITPTEQLMIEPIILTTGAGPVLSRETIWQLEPITGGEDPAELVQVAYNAVVAKPGTTMSSTGTDTPIGPTPGPGEPSGPDLGEPYLPLPAPDDPPLPGPDDPPGPGPRDPYMPPGPGPGDPSGPNNGDPRLRNWTREETNSPSRTYSIGYSGPGGAGTASFSHAPWSTTSTTYTTISYEDAQGNQASSDVVASRYEVRAKCLAAANGAYCKWLLDQGRNCPGTTELTSSGTTTYSYETTQDGPRVVREMAEEIVTAAEILGGLSVPDYGVISFEPEYKVKASITVTNYDYSSDGAQKTSVSRYLPWGNTQEGQQAAAAVTQSEDGSGALTAGILNQMLELVFDGTEVRTSTGRGTPQTRPSGRLPVEDGLTRPDPLTDPPAKPYKMEPIRFDLGGEDLGGDDDFDTANYSLPFAADDYLIAVERVDGTLGMNLVKGNAQAQAREYGLLQNAIRLGHKNGVNITTEVGNLPSKPLAPLFVNAAGISSGFRLNGTTWAFGPTGMVVSTDLLLCGTAGRLAGAEPIPWLPLPVDPDGLPELAPPTVGTSPAPANTIALPGGFNPASPGGTISSLPTGGSDVFALSQSIGHLVVPYLLRESEAVIVRTIARDVEVPYALTLASEGDEALIGRAVNTESGDFIPEPEALFSFAVIDEDDDTLIGFAVIEEAGEP